jgi:hypothetical protein
MSEDKPRGRGPIPDAIDDADSDDIEFDDAEEGVAPLSVKPTPLHADREEVATFVLVLFRYADGNTFASLRAFHQYRADVPPKLILPVAIGGDLQRLINTAFEAANRCARADHPVVFAPPVCTFTNPRHARAQDLANGLVLSVELDQGDTKIAQVRLEYLLGPATVVMVSGGEWVDQATGEVHPRLHLHWRLSEPTRTEDEHARLRQARDLAGQLVGGDPSAKPIVHPLRWPGSWNRKDPDRPRMARIVDVHEAAEIHLCEALEKLQEAAETQGLELVGQRRSANPQASLERLRDAAPFMANPDLHFDDWLRRGYAFWHATGGSPEGFEMFDAFSRKSGKYDAQNTADIWKAVERACSGGNPPITAGAGTIFFHAKLGGWKRRRPEDDPGYLRSLEAEVAERTGRGGARSNGPPPEPEPDGVSDGGSGDSTPPPGDGGLPPPPPDDPPPPPDGGLQPPEGEEPPPPRDEDDDFVLPLEFSENMLAYLFSDQHAAHLVYVHGWGKWMRWDNGRWREDFAVTVFDAARKICAAEGERALHTLPERTAKKVATTINKAACVAAIERLARHHAPQVRPVDVFDADKLLLNGVQQNHQLKGD